MKNKLLPLLFGMALLIFFAPPPVHAQDGIVSGECDDSPENPTVILAVVGSVGAFAASARVRIKASRNSSK